MTNKTNWTNMSDQSNPSHQSHSENKILFKRGGYRNLQSYQMATLVHDLNMEFCRRYVDRRSRTRDQMEQAGRSGRQNIAEGSLASATSKKTEIKLTSVARASMEELLLDYEDYLRQRNLEMWGKNSNEAKAVRGLVYLSNKSYQSYQSYLKNPETGANMMICLIHQTNYLLDQQIRTLEKDFLEKGGFTERMYWKRKEWRERNF